MRALPLDSPLNLSQSCRLACPHLPLVAPPWQAPRNGGKIGATYLLIHVHQFILLPLNKQAASSDCSVIIYAFAHSFSQIPVWIWLSSLSSLNLNFSPFQCKCRYSCAEQRRATCFNANLLWPAASDSNVYNTAEGGCLMWVQGCTFPSTVYSVTINFKETNVHHANHFFLVIYAKQPVPWKILVQVQVDCIMIAVQHGCHSSSWLDK